MNHAKSIFLLLGICVLAVCANAMNYRTFAAAQRVRVIIAEAKRYSQNPLTFSQQSLYIPYDNLSQPDLSKGRTDKGLLLGHKNLHTFEQLDPSWYDAFIDAPTLEYLYTPWGAFNLLYNSDKNILEKEHFDFLMLRYMCDYMLLEYAEGNQLAAIPYIDEQVIDMPSEVIEQADYIDSAERFLSWQKYLERAALERFETPYSFDGLGDSEN